MRTLSRPAKLSDTPTSLALAPRALATAAVAGLCALSVVACGDDKKTTSSGGGSGGSGTPSITDPNNSAGTTPTGGSTGTDIKVSLDGGTVASSKDGLYAVLSYDASTVVVYPYDYCAWAATHDPNGTMASAEGFGLVLNVGPSGAAATAGNPYTVDKQTTASDGTTMYDKNVVATYKYPASGNSCDFTSRGGLSGSVNWTTVSSTQVSGSINATVIDYNNSTSTVTGTFVASKCPSYNYTATAYNSDPLACHDAADQATTKTSGGLHYK